MNIPDLNINRYLAESFEVKTKQEFIEVIKKLYDDAKDLNRINYFVLINCVYSLIEWTVYKQERKAINPNFEPKD